MLKWSLQLHKWLALVVGLQVLFWVVGGLIMTAIPIGTVRGEHHKPSTQAAALNLAEAQAPGSLAAGRAGVAEAALKSSPRGPVWALVLSAGLIAACFWIVRPFLGATIWATMIVVATWPSMLSLQARLGNRRAAAVAANEAQARLWEQAAVRGSAVGLERAVITDHPVTSRRLAAAAGIGVDQELPPEHLGRLGLPQVFAGDCFGNRLVTGRPLERAVHGHGQNRRA